MKQKILSIIAILLVLGLVGILVWNEKEERDHVARMVELQKQAKPYQDELNEIRSELQSLKNEIHIGADIGNVAVGFVPTSVDDLFSIQEWCQDYEFVPVIILDCSMEEDTLIQILRQASRLKYEVILSGMTYNEDVLSNANYIREKLPDYRYYDAPTFFIRGTCDSGSVRADLVENGYTSFIRYTDTLYAGTTSDDIPYISYGFNTTEGDANGFISVITEKKSYTLMAFSFADINNGLMPEKNVPYILRLLDAKIKKGGLCYTTVADAIYNVETAKSDAILREEEFSDYAQQKQQRIDELQKKIDEIYTNWDE